MNPDSFQFIKWILSWNELNVRKALLVLFYFIWSERCFFRSRRIWIRNSFNEFKNSRDDVSASLFNEKVFRTSKLKCIWQLSWKKNCLEKCKNRIWNFPYLEDTSSIYKIIAIYYFVSGSQENIKFASVALLTQRF